MSFLLELLLQCLRMLLIVAVGTGRVLLSESTTFQFRDDATRWIAVVQNHSICFFLTLLVVLMTFSSAFAALAFRCFLVLHWLPEQLAPLTLAAAPSCSVY
jgi:hypothetical protein